MYESELMHYGVKGMKWGVRRNPSKAYFKANKKLELLKERVRTNRVFEEDDRRTSYALRTHNPILATRYVTDADSSADRARRIKKKVDGWQRAMNEAFENISEEKLTKGKRKFDEWYNKNKKYFVEDRYYY